MGIYANTGYELHADGSLHLTTMLPGLTILRVYEPAAVFEHRTNCYCCSCDDNCTDPACRNHGFAATRPCEAHGMPGQTWDLPGDPLNDTMPESVQTIRARRQGGTP